MSTKRVASKRVVHRFEAIRWLGDERTRPVRYGVVEIDEQGPKLLSGPLVKRRADRIARELSKTVGGQR